MWVRILTRPEPGVYQKQFPSETGYPTTQPTVANFAQTSSISQIVQTPKGDFSVAVGSGEGRFIEDNYDYTKGYYWGDYQSQIGSYYEKINAVYYLTEAYNNFVSNTEMDYIDGRYKNLNYGSLYPDQIRRLFAELMQGDPTTLGPYVVPPKVKAGSDNTTALLWLPWEKYDPNEPSTIDLEYAQGGVVVDPLFEWDLSSDPSIFNWFFYAPTSLTTDWVDQARIYSPGAGDTVSYPLDQQIRYMDPISGIEYAARKYGYETVNSLQPTQVATTAGARFLQWANAVAAETFVVTATDPVTGELTYQTDKYGSAVCSASATSCTTFTTKPLNGLSGKYQHHPRAHAQPGHGRVGALRLEPPDRLPLAGRALSGFSDDELALEGVIVLARELYAVRLATLYGEAPPSVSRSGGGRELDGSVSRAHSKANLAPRAQPARVDVDEALLDRGFCHLDPIPVPAPPDAKLGVGRSTVMPRGCPPLRR